MGPVSSSEKQCHFHAIERGSSSIRFTLILGAKAKRPRPKPSCSHRGCKPPTRWCSRCGSAAQTLVQRRGIGADQETEPTPCSGSPTPSTRQATQRRSLSRHSPKRVSRPRRKKRKAVLARTSRQHLLPWRDDCHHDHDHRHCHLLGQPPKTSLVSRSYPELPGLFQEYLCGDRLVFLCL